MLSETPPTTTCLRCDYSRTGWEKSLHDLSKPCPRCGYLHDIFDPNYEGILKAAVAREDAKMKRRLQEVRDARSNGCVLFLIPVLVLGAGFLVLSI